jgi:hypothetical protein
MGDTFPASIRGDLGKVADSLRQVIDDVFRHGSPPLRIPITCLFGVPPRASLDSWSSPNEFQIYVSAQDRDYCRFAFELAHEIGHVYAGVFRSNGAIETIATALSLEALSRLTRRWKVRPPYPRWIDYAPHFQDYRIGWEGRCIGKCPAEIREAAGAGGRLCPLPRLEDLVVFLRPLR